MSFKTSLDEYTPEEIQANGNGLYGGKRHDEICDYLQESYNFKDHTINDISVAIWIAIESERAVSEKKIKSLEAELYQQRFNNEHNLSIDQPIADELARLRRIEKCSYQHHFTLMRDGFCGKCGWFQPKGE